MNPSFLDLIDLASERLGSVVVAANDEFFAPKDNLIRPEPPQWREGEYTDRGKWMDGWETRRRREAGDDWCIIRLGVAGIARGVDVETTHFKGNYPEACAIDAANLPSEVRPERDGAYDARWIEILPRTPLTGDAHNLFAVETAIAATHVRLRIFPDGGVARLRVYGDVVPDWGRLRRRGEVDLAAAEHGGLVAACSDMFFGSRHNLIMPGDATHMGDGWETKRRRGPGHDWVILRLGLEATIRRIEIDTAHFKGNYPDRCSIQAADVTGGTDDSLITQSMFWRTLLPEQKLEMDRPHQFQKEVADIGAITHVRLNIIPDGGVSRLRLLGELV